jgi:hypothetical protein
MLVITFIALASSLAFALAVTTFVLLDDAAHR